jgi:hypothetical protein
MFDVVLRGLRVRLGTVVRLGRPAPCTSKDGPIFSIVKKLRFVHGW